MTLRVRKSDLFQTISVFLLVLYAFTNGLEKYIYMGSIYAIVLAFVVSIFFMLLCNVRKVQIGKIDMLVVFMMLIILLNNNQNIANGDYTSTIFSMTIFLFFIISRHTNEWHGKAMKIICFMGIIYALLTVIFMFTPDFYKNTVLLIFGDYGFAESMAELYDKGYMPGFTPHYSTNAIYLTVAMGVPAVFFLNKGKSKKYLISFIIIFVALLLTGKRAHCIFGTVALIISYYFLNCDKPTKRIFKIFGGVLGGAAIVLITAQFIPTVLNFIYRFVETAEVGDVTLGREVQVLLAIETFAENKLFGIGWDGYKYMYESLSGEILNVHCVYVQLLCECGIVGSIPFFAFFITTFVHAVKSMIKLVKEKVTVEPVARITLSFAIYIEAFFLMYCFTGNPLYDSQILFPYVFACSIGEFYYFKLRKLVNKTCDVAY